MKQMRAKILANDKMAEGRFKIILKAPSISKKAMPGQFVMVRCSEDLDPFLRRPLSFHKIGKAHFELLYQVIGKGTEILSQRKKGESLDIIGPLGNGFNTGKRSRPIGRAILVAGGIGIAPLVALAKRLKADRVSLTAFLGTRTKGQLLCIDDLKGLGARLHIATEDGSRGYKGLITNLLKRRLTVHDSQAIIYACGPHQMLKAIAMVAKKKRLTCQVSLEERMACGTGACLGCAVKTMTGIRMACKDGPIFKSGDIVW